MGKRTISTWSGVLVSSEYSLFINKYLEELEMTLARNSSKFRGLHVARKSLQSGCLIPPNRVPWKINIDGRLSRDGRRGPVVAVCNDGSGQYLGVLAIVFEGLVDLARLEAHTCNEAVSLVHDLYLSSIQVACDCLGLSRTSWIVLFADMQSFFKKLIIAELHSQWWVSLMKIDDTIMRCMHS